MTTHLTNHDAITLATRWIRDAQLPFFAAFVSGSVATAQPDGAYDPASDIDCYLVVDGEPPAGKIGKFTVDGVLLDVSWLSVAALEDAEQDAVLASLVDFGQVVCDADGRLTALQQRISAGFATPEAIRARLENMRAKIRIGLGGDSSHLPLPEQVMNWVFPATLATHVPLIAGRVPLTVRKRFLAAKRVMSSPAYEELLALFGFDAVMPEHAQTWLDDTTALLDATAELAQGSARFWASDIRRDARHIAVGGSQALIDAGLHREALYWIIATSARCLTVWADAGAESSAWLPGFMRMLTELGIATSDQRAAKTRAILDWIEESSTTY